MKKKKKKRLNLLIIHFRSVSTKLISAFYQHYDSHIHSISFYSSCSVVEREGERAVVELSLGGLERWSFVGLGS